MIGVVGGLVAALLWGLSAVAGSRSSRQLGEDVALFWVLATGLCVALVGSVGSELPEESVRGLAWGVPSAVLAISSLYLMYAALRRGPVSLVLPVTALQGALAALVAVLLGEDLRLAAGLGLVLSTSGLIVVLRRPVDAAARAAHPVLALVLALGAALTAGFGLYGAAEAAGTLGTAPFVVLLRTTGVVLLGALLVVTGRLRPPGAAWRLVVFSGFADTCAFAAYVYAATRDGVAVPAVLASQYAAVAALVAIGALGERLTRVQLAGVAAILVGVGVVTAAQA